MGQSNTMGADSWADPIANAKQITLACTIAISAIIFACSLGQGYTRMRAGGKVPGRESQPEDLKMIKLAGGGQMTDEMQEQRLKTASRWQNLASNNYEMPPFCIIVLWASLMSCSCVEYANTIATCSVVFTVCRVVWMLAFIAGFNPVYFPIRSVGFLGSMAATFTAAYYGLHGAALSAAKLQAN